MFIEDLFFFNLFLVIFYETIVFSTKHGTWFWENLYDFIFFMKLQVRDQKLLKIVHDLGHKFDMLIRDDSSSYQSSRLFLDWILLSMS